MKTTQKTTAKTTKTTAAKTTQKTLVYAAMLGDALAGKYGEIIRRFYVNAMLYHDKQKTTFPRARIADVALLSPDDAREFLDKHNATSIPPGSLTGQRIFDAMMIESAQLPKASK